MEIEERLAGLEGRVGELSDRVSGGLNLVNKRIDDLNHSLSKRIDDVRSDMNFRFNILLALDICILGAILGVLFKLIFS